MRVETRRAPPAPRRLLSQRHLVGAPFVGLERVGERQGQGVAGPVDACRRVGDVGCAHIDVERSHDGVVLGVRRDHRDGGPADPARLHRHDRAVERGPGDGRVRGRGFEVQDVLLRVPERTLHEERLHASAGGGRGAGRQEDRRDAGQLVVRRCAAAFRAPARGASGPVWRPRTDAFRVPAPHAEGVARVAAELPDFRGRPGPLVSGVHEGLPRAAVLEIVVLDRGPGVLGGVPAQGQAGGARDFGPRGVRYARRLVDVRDRDGHRDAGHAAHRFGCGDRERVTRCRLVVVHDSRAGA